MPKSVTFCHNTRYIGMKVKCLLKGHKWENFDLYEKFAGMDTKCKARKCIQCGKRERI